CARLPKAFAIASSKVETIFHPVLLVMASEVIVDWLKHAFITKFNHIRPSVYNRFVDVLCQDFIPAGAHPVSRICQPIFRTTHRLFLISGGQDLAILSAPDGYMGIPRTLYYIDNAKIFVRDPFAWVARNPEQGYVLSKRTDGSQDYDFYHQDAPGIKIHVKFFPQVNGYFFMNENGNQIIIN
ncbi:MAG: hypothetical protein EOP48_25520, partial [Sphingobacteriales bacterium]